MQKLHNKLNWEGDTHSARMFPTAIQRLAALIVLFLSVAFVLPTSSRADGEEKDPFPLLREERIGNLRIGMGEDEVKKKVSCKLKRGKEALSQATGQYEQLWEYLGCGLWLVMTSESRGGPKEIDRVIVRSPSTLRTKRGIHIGSTEQDVIKAYGRCQDEDSRIHTKRGEQFVAGSIYGGIVFSFRNGRVSEILLGAAAE